MRKINTQEELNLALVRGSLKKLTFQTVDLTGVEARFLTVKTEKCLFLDCKMSAKLRNYLSDDNYIFPRLNVPYNIYPAGLYDKDSLYCNYDYEKPETYFQTMDKIVYDYYKKMGGAETRSIQETLARSLHDHSVNDAMDEFLDLHDERKTVAMMGGHQLGRDDAMFAQVALLSKTLTEQGFLMVSGGGPGAMEATHLGAWCAGKSNDDLNDAIRILSAAPDYTHPDWLKMAFRVIEKYPEPQFVSLGVPTWLYGHELSTPFATHIAKLFENSLREEGLLAVAKGGVIFSPGSAGTMQEIFQDLAQNHYSSYGYPSPMIFLGADYWNHAIPIFPLLKILIESGKLNKQLDISIYNDNQEIIHHLRKNTGDNN